MEDANNFYPTSFDPIADAKALHKAFKGVGTNEKVVIEILANRSKHQLQEINKEYQHQSEKKHNLRHALESEISGDFLKLAIAVITPTLEFKAHTLESAVVGFGTRESSLIDVLTQSENSELAYFSGNQKLRNHVLGDVSGDFKHVLEELLKAHRPHGAISDAQAAEIAHEFYKAGEGKIGTDEKKYIHIIVNNSIEALKQVNQHYKATYKHSLRKAVERETSGDFKNVLVALLTPRYTYVARRLYQAVVGVGTDERTLIYFFATLDKAELKRVEEVFQKKYQHSLKDKVGADTSGDFKKFLIALL